MFKKYYDDEWTDISRLFVEGNLPEAYSYFGAHKKRKKDLEGYQFLVWAPHAKKVRLIGDFNHWYGQDFELKKNDYGCWHIFVTGLLEGQCYKYEIETQKGKIIHKSDPFGFYSELRPQTASRLAELGKYKWGDGHWKRYGMRREPYRRPINIYEIHPGSWKLNEYHDFLNYRELADKLIPYLKEMHYTHVELMPINEHPFDGSWGYQATGYFSVTSRYGGLEDFAYFVDQCHQANLGVIIDWVACHYCKDAHGLYHFDGSPCFESENIELAENNQWGTANFDYGKKAVQNFLISNALFWLSEYHIDGIRVDAVAFMIYLNYGKERSKLKNKFGGEENLEAISFIKQLNKTVFEKFPHALMIAEESTAWPLVTAPTYLGGLGFNFKWNMGWMNDILKYMEKPAVERKKYHNLINFSITYAYSENFILPFSHDEVVHGKKSLLNKMPGDYSEKFSNLRALLGYMIGHPGKKLLFMGSEFGQFIEWDYKNHLDWLLFDYDMHTKLHDFVRALNQLYLEETALFELDDTFDGFRWIDADNSAQSTIIFIRQGKRKKDKLIIITNFSDQTYRHFRIGVPDKGIYSERLNSNDIKYGGNGQVSGEEIKSSAIAWHGCKHSIEITLPAYTTIYLKKNNMR